ncbi:MAG TPA: RluA family pseudouridine synthase [Pirellulales bacterium]|jgi:23S rRNA pseudouridine1911/1915/1917 synthase|nr:RluA family pseudouridine synthase [Pirellulales bacterium]
MTRENDQILRAGPLHSQRTVTAFLREQLPGRSWSDVRRLISSRQVMIDGNLCLDGGRRLRGTEVVKLLAHPTAPPPREEDVRILYVDAHLVVVDKPPRMTSVRHAEEQGWSSRRKQLQPTLEDVLPRAVARKLSRGERGRRGAPPGKLPPVKPVHRLDRDTSGIMVFARTKAAEQRLVQQFRRHTTERRYLAIAQGHVAAQTVESHLVRDRGDGRRGSTATEDTGKRAITHIKPLEQFDRYTLIECQLETGRTHQIRIHLAELGHPVCGETVYHKPLNGPASRDDSGAPRLALHAAELQFDHPITGERVRFHSPFPHDLAAFLERIRRL